MKPDTSGMGGARGNDSSHSDTKKNWTQSLVIYRKLTVSLADKTGKNGSSVILGNRQNDSMTIYRPKATDKDQISHQSTLTACFRSAQLRLTKHHDMRVSEGLPQWRSR